MSLETGASEAIDYLWNTGETTAAIEMTTSGAYNVEVYNAKGCVAKDTVNVTIIGDAPNTQISIPTEICKNAIFSFEDQSSTTDGSDIIGWKPKMFLDLLQKTLLK